MIGIGNDYKVIPTDPKENVQWRIRLIEACDDNPTLRAGIIEICRRDIRFYASAFLWQFNPDETGNELGPWISYEFQNEAIAEAVEWWVVRRKDYNWEKSRKMGASWMALFIQDWACRFHSWKKFIDVSHMDDAVVAKDSDSLFWKIRHMHDHLPEWLLGRVESTKRQFDFLDTNSSIAGRSQTKRTGVGGRGNVFCDEVGKMENAKAIIGQTVATGPRLFCSTHYPEGRAYAELCDRPDLKKRILHWVMHPKYNQGLYKWDKEAKQVVFGKWNQKTKQIDPCAKCFNYGHNFEFITDGYPSGGPYPGWRSPWYDEESARYQTRRDVSIHLDIDRVGADSPVFDPMMIAELRLTRARNPDFQGDVMYDSDCHITQMIERYPGPLRIWAKLDPSGQYPPGPYGAGIDPARGTGATASCMSITNAKTGQKVLEYRDAHIEPYEFAFKAVSLCKVFYNALLAWEIPGPGIDFGRHVIKSCGYRHVWKQRIEAPHRMRVTVSDKPGWTANSKNANELITRYMDALSRRLFVNPSTEALAECMMFKWTVEGNVKHKQYMDEMVDESGVGVNHGDLVVSDALSWLACVQLGIERPKPLEPDVNHTKPGSWLHRRAMAEEEDRVYDEEHGLAE